MSLKCLLEVSLILGTYCTLCTYFSNEKSLHFEISKHIFYSPVWLCSLIFKIKDLLSIHRWEILFEKEIRNKQK